jgi:hypothetical protein
MGVKEEVRRKKEEGQLVGNLNLFGHKKEDFFLPSSSLLRALNF